MTPLHNILTHINQLILDDIASDSHKIVLSTMASFQIPSFLLPPDTDLSLFTNNYLKTPSLPNLTCIIHLQNIYY